MLLSLFGSRESIPDKSSSPPAKTLSRRESCQLDTNIHLWRITAHNAVHHSQVAEMLKAPPHHFRAGAVAPTAPHKPAELGHPVDRLAERRRLFRRRRDPMNGTIQRLPFVRIQKHTTRHIWHRARQHSGVKNPPGQDAVKRQ